MGIHSKIGGAILAASLATSAPLLAHAADAMPEPKHEGDISYVSGGVGDGEQQAISAQGKDYNLLVSNADDKGQFVAGEDFVIRNGKGDALVTAHNTGPLFYAKLPVGDYTVDVTNGQQMQKKTINISGSGQDHLNLTWR